MKKNIILVVLGIMLLPFAYGKIDDSGVRDEQELSKADVLAAYAVISKDVQNVSEKKALTSMVYAGFSECVKSFMNRRFVELDTEIDMTWYEKTFKLLEYMADCKQYMHCMELANKQQDTDYIKAKSNFEEAHKRFAELVKKPTPVDKDKLEKLRADKHKWEAEKRR
jgi:hypothetical protein